MLKRNTHAASTATGEISYLFHLVNYSNQRLHGYLFIPHVHLPISTLLPSNRVLWKVTAPTQYITGKWEVPITLRYSTGPQFSLSWIFKYKGIFLLLNTVIHSFIYSYFVLLSSNPGPCSGQAGVLPLGYISSPFLLLLKRIYFLHAGLQFLR